MCAPLLCRLHPLASRSLKGCAALVRRTPSHSLPPFPPCLQMDMIDLINDEFGTSYDDDTPWAQILLPGTLPRSPRGAPVGASPSAVLHCPVPLAIWPCVQEYVPVGMSPGFAAPWDALLHG